MKPWSLVTRITHWMIAVPVMLDFFIEGGDLSHKVLGYLAFASTLFRLVWGFLTKDEARFSSFPLSAREVWQYGKSIFSQKLIHHSGHNPLASWVYIVIWILVLGLGVTGHLMGLDAFWGDERLEEIHEGMSNALVALVGLHLFGIAIDSWKFKRKTWKGMFTGEKS